MELFSAEAESIQKRVTDWIGHPNFELEATFGNAHGEVDSSTFLAVAKRLRAKGYMALPQEDRLTITTPEHLRMTLTTMGIIRKYCEDDTIVGKPFVAIIKDRATAEAQVDLDDYAVRVKLRREIPLAATDASLKSVLESWEQQRKAFRIIRRWSFEGDGLRVDMSIVRSTKKDKRGTFVWQRGFKDQDIAMAKPTYEIEVELLHKEGDTATDATKRLIKGVGEVLRGIQKHSVLIRKSTKAKVLSAYKELTGTDLFRGPSLLVLMKKNFGRERVKGAANIRDGYNVTDKADGLRTLGFVDSKGDLYLIDMGMNVYRTGLRRPELRLSLVDGEWVTQTNDNPPKPIQQYLIFDIFYAPEKRDVSQFPFQPGAVAPMRSRASGPAAEEGPVTAAPPPENSRYNHLNAWAKAWNDGDGPKVMLPGINEQTKLRVAAKEYFFARAGDESIFTRCAARVLAAARPYYTDGLIFTPNATPLPRAPAGTFYEQFKWKPSHDNTIDFLVSTEKEKDSKLVDKVTTAVKPGTNEMVRYKTLRLFVGGHNENPRDVILNRKELPRPVEQGARGAAKKGEYKPVIFTPSEFPDSMAHVCCLEIHRDQDTGEEYVATGETGEPIQDRTIVEMSYDPSEPPGWRWKPLRVRMDKTERYQRGIISRTLNSELTAEDTWNSIYDPITETMIRTGVEEPTEEELALTGQTVEARKQIARRYFEREGPTDDASLVDGLKKFHTRWIKERILYHAGLSGEGKQLLDLACGVAGDLHIWRRAGVKFVMGVDNAAKNIMGSADSAYKRYMKIAQEVGGVDLMEPMIFAIADSSKTLVDGKAAGDNQEEADILRAVFGRVAPVGQVPPFIAEFTEGRLKQKADCVSCMFAIHYFFESEDKLAGLLKNIADTLKVGGYFIGCCFDGEKVFRALSGKAKGEPLVGMEGKSELWRITKDYDADELPEGGDGFGLGVNVFFKTIGAEHREFLVPFKLLEDRMRMVGCELLSTEELRSVGLVNSSATFDASYEMAERNGQKFTMGKAAKEFSFMNRWFVFKRKREEAAAEAAVAEATAAAAAARVNASVAAAAASAAPEAVGRAANARRSAEAAARAATNLAEAANAPGGISTPGAASLAAAAALAANAAGVSGNGRGAPAAAFTNVQRTVAVEPGSAAPAAVAGKTYSQAEVFLFYSDAATSKDILKIGDKGAGQYLAPSAPFPIDDEGVIYPTMEHYLAGMRVKVGAKNPSLASSLFSREGTIHQKFLNDRLVQSNGGTKALSEKQDHEIMKAEISAVRDAQRPPSLKKYKAVVDEAAWATAKNAAVEAAAQQRWTKDARFRRIVEAARNQGKYLLYYTPGASTSNMGGVRSAKTDRIEGENRVGKVIMRLAGYPE